MVLFSCLHMTPKLMSNCKKYIHFLIIQIIYLFFFFLLLIYTLKLCFGIYEVLLYLFTTQFLNYTTSLHVKYYIFMKKSLKWWSKFDLSCFWILILMLGVKFCHLLVREFSLQILKKKKSVMTTYTTAIIRYEWCVCERERVCVCVCMPCVMRCRVVHLKFFFFFFKFEDLPRTMYIFKCPDTENHGIQ